MRNILNFLMKFFLNLTFILAFNFNYAQTTLITASATTVCAGAPVILTGYSSFTPTIPKNCSWYIIVPCTNVGGWFDTQQKTITVYPTQTTTYYAWDGSIGCYNAGSVTITVNPLPVPAGTISGLAAVCQGQNSVTYTVPTITNATSYVWTLPSGATGTSTTNSIAVSYGTSAVSGNITVKGNNACGNGTTSTLAITVNPLPVAAGTISGLTAVCQGQNSIIYTVPTITNATSYVWTLPSGATGTSTTSSITVNYGTSAVSGNITVKGNNTCGVGAISTLAITVNPLPVVAGTISGLASVCQGQNSVTYTVPTITNASSYVWTLPSGATGTSTTSSITVSYGTSAVSGNLTVKGNNTCGDGAISTLAITVNPLPVSAGIISGATTVCQGQNSVTYAVPTITNATSYVWTLPSGATGTSTTSSITVSYGTSAVSGNISVKGNNTCGDGAISTLAITVNPLPVSAGIISGLASVCQGQNSVTYTVPTITTATSYVWTLPSGATGTSTTSSIIVNYGTSAVSGNITVKGNNTCGDGAISTLTITVNPLPVSAGTISGLTAVCQGQNSVTYTVPTITNATSYVWTLPSGATGTSTTSSITVSYGTSAVSGNITVKGNNTCGDGVISTLAITLNSLPASAGNISGTTTVCQGQNSITYSVPTIANASSYVWVLPSGATGTSTTSSITVNYGTSAVSGNITVKGNNNCGDGIISTLAITVNMKPNTPVINLNGNILHSDVSLGNQWYNQIGIISEATNQDYIVNTNGSYYTVVTINGCSSEQSNIIQITNVGVENIRFDNLLKVYPNPLLDQLTIEMDDNTNPIRFEIYNSLGQVVVKGEMIDKIILQTTGYAPGVYVLKLINGEMLEYRKIVKE
jgi:large repetitive protein